jgi:hypothetical protein
MRIRPLTLLLVGGSALLFCFWANAQPYPGTNLRGRIDMFNPYTRSLAPARGIVVELFTAGRVPGQWSLVVRTATDFAGFYYFSRITPGQYVLRFAERMNFTIAVVPIDYRIQQFQDIPPFRLM